MVRNNILKFGEDAGKVWTTLYKKGPLQKKQLIEETDLKEHEIQSAIGWLAREDKICVGDGGFYSLDSCNLVGLVGSQAGRVWKILDIWGDVDFESILRLSDLSVEEVYRAIGWLSREDKIVVDDVGRFCLK
jgi:hypothetical protein